MFNFKTCQFFLHLCTIFHYVMPSAFMLSTNRYIFERDVRGAPMQTEAG